MDPIVAVGRRMAAQHGVVSRSQAEGAGLTKGRIQHEINSGRWIRLTAGVYAATSSSPTWERQLWAAIAGHPDSVAGGRSAAALHGFASMTRTRPEILTSFEGNARSPLARVIRSRHFERIATRRVSGFPVTTVAETILTLSLREVPSTLETIVDDELARRHLSIVDFDPILERLTNARQPGLRTLRRIVAERDIDAYQPPLSDLERLLYSLLEQAPIPPWEKQVPMTLPRVDAVVDGFIPDWGLIVEGDGRRWHTRVADFERDRRRDNAAAAAGLVVVRFTYAMLQDSRDSCVRTLVDAGRWREAGRVQIDRHTVPTAHALIG